MKKAEATKEAAAPVQETDEPSEADELEATEDSPAETEEAETEKDILESKLAFLESGLGMNKETTQDNKETEKQQVEAKSSSLESLMNKVKEGLQHKEAAQPEKEAATSTAVTEAVVETPAETTVFGEDVVCDTFCKGESSFVCTSDDESYTLLNIHATLMEALTKKVPCCTTMVTVTNVATGTSSLTLAETTSLIFSTSSVYSVSSCSNVSVNECDFNVPSGYTYQPNRVVIDSGYEMVEGAIDVEDMGKLCDNDSDCAAFTTSGALLKSTYTTQEYTDYCTGIFTQQSSLSAEGSS